VIRAASDHERRVRAGEVEDGATLYCVHVLEGKIAACRKIKKACKRHLRDLKHAETESFPYYFDLEAAARPVEFARKLKHWQGEWAGQFFDPMPWQQFILGSTFGWKRCDNDRRRFRYAYVEIPRKNGKSFLASIISIYMLIADGESGAEIYALATKREQAKIVWGAAIEIAKRSGLMGKYLSEHWLSLKMKMSASRFEPLASDSEKLDGLNPHCAICDELHEWTDRKLWDVIEDAFGARSQPLMFVITTAGYNRNGICFQQRSHGESILDAAETRTYCDDTYFVFIADVDEEDRKNWDQERVWRMANPCLGVAKSLEYMRDQCNKAKQMPGKENAFLNKQLDIWTEAAKRWLDMKRWDECGEKIDKAMLKLKPCYTGLDLSSTTDLTASVDVFPPGPYPEWTVVPYFYLPQDNLEHRERRDKVPYRDWVRQGLITLTPGDVIDLEFVKRDTLARKALYNIKEVGYDPWKAVEIATYLEQQGMNMTQMRQGHATLGAPSTFLETAVLKRTLRHGGHPILRWMAANTAVIRDSNDNIRPDKAESSQRIDGIVATIMGIGLGIAAVGSKGSPYERRGLRMLGGK
jgi:phage terminase large subunit-like protein